VDVGDFSLSEAALTRRVRFHAAHRYHRPEWDEARNHAVFGACAAPEPHAHEYTCDVTVRGAVDAVTGMVLDLGVFDRVIESQVTRPLEGRVVNEVFSEFAPGERIPTCEELARVLASRIDAALQASGASARVQSVRIAEDESLSATWFAEG
jgi:6-pyruvoyltetrahydropterin/6-carboxytetrahydropterin synthase